MFASIDDVAIDRRTLERLTTLRHSHHTGHAVIVALRRAQRPVWAPGVRILRNFLGLRIDRGFVEGSSTKAWPTSDHAEITGT
jgi:hypothetical protein